jgi:hypothetical protein
MRSTLMTIKILNAKDTEFEYRAKTPDRNMAVERAIKHHFGQKYYFCKNSEISTANMWIGLVGYSISSSTTSVEAEIIVYF